MPKWGAVGIGKEAADVDPDTIDNVYDEASLGVPPKGPYLVVVKRFEVGETGESSATPGSPKVTLLFEIAEPAGTKKARYNGYGLWLHRAATEESAGRINQILLALLDNTKLPAAKRKLILQAFHDRNVVVEKPDARGNQIVTKIGTWAVPEGMVVGINTKAEKYNDEDRLAVTAVMSKNDAPKGTKADVVDDEPEAEDEEVDELDDLFGAREEELGGYTIAKLKTTAKGLGLTVKRGATEDDLITAILDEEFPEDDEPEDEPEEEPEEDDEPDEEDAARASRGAAGGDHLGEGAGRVRPARRAARRGARRRPA